MITYKPEFRKSIRARRKHLNAVAIQQLSQQIAAKSLHLDQLFESKHIGYYVADEGEVDPSPIIQSQILQQKLFYLPVIASHEEKCLSYYLHQPHEPLQTNRYGIKEPSIENKKPIDLQLLDLVFVPLVAFDSSCNRIGRGAGYYDHTFVFTQKLMPHQKRPLLIGLGYEFQKIPNITPSSWDVPLDFVVTEEQIYQRI